MSLTADDLINQGLRSSGLPLRIGSVYDGSEAAKIAVELYGQCRDELLRIADWSFSRKVAALALLKGPPPAGGFTPAVPWSNIYPAPGFLYEYAYPSDCLALRAIISPPGVMPDLDPLAALFRIDNDPVPVVSGTPPVAAGPAQKIVLCNTTSAMAVYRARITDPTLWEPGFIAGFVAELGKRFAKAFGAAPEQQKENAVEAGGTVQMAEGVRG